MKFVGDPVALVIADSRYLAEDAVDLVAVDYEPLPAIVDFRHAVGGAEAGIPWSTTRTRTTSPAAWRACRPTRRSSPSAAYVVTRERLSADLRPGADRDARHGRRVDGDHRRADDLGVHPDTARVTAVLRAAAWAYPPNTSGSSCATPAAGSVRRSSRCARTCASCWPPARCAAPLKWIEDRRENLMSAGQSRHVDGNVRMAFDDDGNILAADIDFVQDVGAYPTPYPVLTTAAVGMFFPGRTGCRRPASPTRRCSRIPLGCTPIADRGSTRRWPARCCSTSRPARWAWIPSSCAGATCCARDEMPYSNPNGMPYDHIAPAGDLRAGRQDPRLEGVPHANRPRPTQGRYLGVGFSAYIEPTAPPPATTRPKARPSGSSRPGKVNVYVAGGSTGNSLETTVVQLTADALGVNIDDVRHHPGRHRGDALRRRDAAAAAAAPMTAGAVSETAAPSCATGSSRSPRTSSRRRIRRHRAGDSSRASARTDPAKACQLRRDLAYRAYLRPAAAARRAPRRPRGDDPLHVGRR